MRAFKKVLLLLLVLVALLACLQISAQAAWEKDSTGWYYVTANGARSTNTWQKDSVGWCYLGSNGYMVTNKWVRDSVGWCYVGADGYMVTNEWIKDSVGWCYVGADGYMVTNEWIKDSVGWCYVGADGYCLVNEFVQDSIGWCFLDDQGRMVKSNWVITASNELSYIDSDGYRVTGWYYIAPYLHYFDTEGIMATDQWIDGLYVDKYGQLTDAQDKAHEYLADWLIKNGTVVGSYAELQFQLNDVTYALGYAINNDYVYLVRHQEFEGTPTTCMMLLFTDEVFFDSTFGNIHMVGYLDRDNFTANYPLAYTKYEGDPAVENIMSELTRAYLCELLDILDTYLAVNDADITLVSLGFGTYYWDRAGQ